MSFRTPIGRVRGLGSAKGGTHHWWMQRLTAAALVPLIVWFVAAVVGTGGGYADVVLWMRSPLTMVLLLCLIGALFHHAQLGVQVVIEDYVHAEVVKFACIVALKLLAVVVGVACAVAVLRVGLGGMS